MMCPNKVTLMKGNVKVSNGQHYVQFDDGTIVGVLNIKRDIQ